MNELDCVLFTDGHMLRCTTPLQERRFLDVLNDPRTEFLKVFNVRMATEPYSECTVTLGDCVLPKPSIQLAIPIVDKHEAPEKRYNAFAAKQEHPAFVLAGRFEVCGRLHLKGTDDPTYFLTHELDRFIPLTDARVSQRGKLVYSHPIQVVLVNKKFVDMVHVAEQTSNLSSSIEASRVTASSRSTVNQAP
jgi:hypothetical protein